MEERDRRRAGGWQKDRKREREFSCRKEIGLNPFGGSERVKGAKRQPLLVEKRRSLSHNNIPLFFSDLASETAKTLIPEAGLRYPSLDPPSHQKRLPRGPLRFIVTIVFARWKRKQCKIKQGERERFFPRYYVECNSFSFYYRSWLRTLRFKFFLLFRSWF